MRRILLAAAVLIPSIAHAERKSGGLPPADPVHDFHTTDRFTPVTTFGVELGFLSLDDSAIDQAIGFDIGGHFVSASGVGGYVVLPLSYIETEDFVIPPFVNVEGESELAVGNVELGGMFAVPMGEHADFVAHVGVALPTADDDGAGLLQYVASTPRYGDFVQRWPNTTWLRLGVSPMGRAGPAFFRADVGLDLMLDDDDDTGGDISPVIRVNVAGGLDFGKGEVSAELATNITDPEDDAADETNSTFAVGARFTGSNVQPGLAVILPVGFDDVVQDTVDFAIAVSVMARVP